MKSGEPAEGSKAWYEKLPPKQKREWVAPTTVFKHCPLFAKAKPETDDEDTEKPLTPGAQKDRQAIMAAALEEIDRLKKSQG